MCMFVGVCLNIEFVAIICPSVTSLDLNTMRACVFEDIIYRSRICSYFKVRSQSLVKRFSLKVDNANINFSPLAILNV